MYLLIFNFIRLSQTNFIFTYLKKIISGSDDNLIKVWDLNSGECLRTLFAHSGEVNCIEIISNEKLVSGSSDKTLKVWDLNTYECILTLYGHTDWVFINFFISNYLKLSLNL